MSARLSLEYTNVMNHISESEITALEPKVRAASDMLYNKTGKGSDFLGWVNLPEYAATQVKEIQETAEKIKGADVLVVIGIGGSYLGARAVIEACNGPFSARKKGYPEVLYAGHNISADYLTALCEYLKDRDFYINVISKSGTTTEPSVAFRFLTELCRKKYGNDYAKRIIATTDASKGALRKLADSLNMKTYVIPDDVGGRFSVLTPVGLLPIAASGIDIEQFVKGAVDMMKISQNKNLYENPADFYAALRYLLYTKGMKVELLSNFEPALHYISEWWKQLYGESEGKDKKGLFPASCDFSTDLHSMGQYIQDGLRMIFETFLHVVRPAKLALPNDPDNLDGLNFISGKEITEINNKAYEGTRLAHLDGGVPNLTISLPDISPYYIGQLLYFFEKGVGVSGYLLEVNPFDQPGVEDYKKNMFALLKKPGFEEMTAKIEKRIAETEKKVI